MDWVAHQPVWVQVVVGNAVFFLGLALIAGFVALLLGLLLAIGESGGGSVAVGFVLLLIVGLSLKFCSEDSNVATKPAAPAARASGPGSR